MGQQLGRELCCPWLRDYWTSSYFRGALSGLGLLNIYISLGELLRLRVRARLPTDRAA